MHFISACRFLILFLICFCALLTTSAIISMSSFNIFMMVLLKLSDVFVELVGPV